MLLLAADENFNNDIVPGLLRRRPDLDIVRLQGCGAIRGDVPSVLEWAAQDGRVLLTHDVSTITRHAYDRVRMRWSRTKVSIENEALKKIDIENHSIYKAHSFHYFTVKNLIFKS